MTVGVARRSFHCLLLAAAALAFALGLFGATAPAHAGTTVVNQTVYLYGGVAIKGYDPVAYFTMGKPVKGSEEFAHKWLGANWQFASAEHRDTFAADPAKYAPRYGGYCSKSIAEGYTADIKPQAWRIVDGKLYLLGSKRSLSLWEQDNAGKIVTADANWPAIKAHLAK